MHEISLWVDAEARPMRVLATGELDLDGGDRLEALVSELVSRGEAVAIDLSAVSFMDSSGLGELISLAQGPGDVVLEDASPAVLRVMEITGTTDVIQLGPPARVRGEAHDVFHHAVA